MIEKHGRKFFLTMVCITSGLVVTLLALFMNRDVPSEFTNVLIASSMIFNGANAAIEWKHAGSSATRQETVNRREEFVQRVYERRDSELGVEATDD